MVDMYFISPNNNFCFQKRTLVLPLGYFPIQTTFCFVNFGHPISWRIIVFPWNIRVLWYHNGLLHRVVYCVQFGNQVYKILIIFQRSEFTKTNFQKTHYTKISDISHSDPILRITWTPFLFQHVNKYYVTSCKFARSRFNVINHSCIHIGSYLSESRPSASGQDNLLRLFPNIKKLENLTEFSFTILTCSCYKSLLV